MSIIEVFIGLLIAVIVYYIFDKIIHEKWKDVMVFHHEYNSYLLQGRKSKIKRATSFRITKAGKRLEESQLKEAGLWES